MEATWQKGKKVVKVVAVRSAEKPDLPVVNIVPQPKFILKTKETPDNV